MIDLVPSEAAVKGCSYEKVFRNYAANLQENTHAEVRFNFIEIALRHGCSPVTLLHMFRTPFLKNISVRLLLYHYIYFLLEIIKYVFQMFSKQDFRKDLFRCLNLLKSVIRLGSPPLSVVVIQSHTN